MTILRRTSLVMASVILSHQAAAQFTVTVRTGEAPVSGAEVMVWGAQELLAATRTDGAGHAYIPAIRGGNAPAFVLVRRLGFVPARLPWIGGDSLALNLIAAPALLPVLALATKSLSCPAASEREAEELWARAAARYSRGATELFFQWIGGRIEETVSAEQRGYGDGGDFRAVTRGAILPDTTARGRILLRNPPPYAVYERHTSLTGEYSRWRYAPLQDAAAEHFVSPGFRERHALVVLGHSADGTILGFCPRSTEEAEITGELQFGEDGALRAARWFVEVPHADEGAGGEATFSETTFEGQRYVVAIHGSTWRRASQGLFNQDRFAFIRWRFGRTLADSRVQ